MRRYEYKLFKYDSNFRGRPLETSLNMLGNEGWKLVSTTLVGDSWLFMREIPQANPQQDVDV